MVIVINSLIVSLVVKKKLSSKQCRIGTFIDQTSDSSRLVVSLKSFVQLENMYVA